MFNTVKGYKSPTALITNVVGLGKMVSRIKVYAEIKFDKQILSNEITLMRHIFKNGLRDQLMVHEWPKNDDYAQELEDSPQLQNQFFL